jgi:3-dehydroquinate dehydratase
MKILLVHGANLTFLGRREPAIYTTTAAELDATLRRHGEAGTGAGDGGDRGGVVSAA